jgi:hypothetical protein
MMQNHGLTETTSFTWTQWSLFLSARQIAKDKSLTLATSYHVTTDVPALSQSRTHKLAFHLTMPTTATIIQRQWWMNEWINQSINTEHWWNDMTGDSQRTRKNAGPSVAMSTRNLTRTGLGSNTVPRWESQISCDVWWTWGNSNVPHKTTGLSFT